VGINAYRIYPAALRCLHVDTRVRVARSLARSLARWRCIVILCTSGPMNMDSLASHHGGSSSIYAGASSRRGSTEPFTRESRKSATRNAAARVREGGGGGRRRRSRGAMLVIKNSNFSVSRFSCESNLARAELSARNEGRGPRAERADSLSLRIGISALGRRGPAAWRGSYTRACARGCIRNAR